MGRCELARYAKAARAAPLAAISVMLAGVSDRAAELLSLATGHQGHLAGTDAERRTATDLAGELRSIGMEPEVEPIWVHPRWPLTHALHCLVGAAGSILAVEVPIAGFALVFAAATSFYLDVSARWYLLRRITFRRASQNVAAVPSGDEDPDRELILLTASYDAPRTGAVFNRAPARTLALLRRISSAVSPTALVFWSLALLLPALGVRMAGIEASWLSILQLPPTIVLVIATFYYGEIALSPPSPAANLNGGGVAAAIRAAELAREAGTEARLGVVLCGGGDCDEQGVRSYLRSHAEELREAPTYVIGIEGGAAGEPRYARRSAGPLTEPADPRLEEAAEALAADGPLEELGLVPGATAAVASRYGYPSIQLCAREGGEYLSPRQRTLADTADECDPTAIEALATTAADLIQLLDRDLSRERRRAGAEAGAAI